MDIIEEIKLNLKLGRAKKVKELVLVALNNGIDVKDILEDTLLATMITIDENFKDNVILVPEVLVIARAVNAGIEILNTSVLGNNISNNEKVILGTVRGDLHDIGKNFVKIIMEGKGLQVIDLGVDVPPEKFVVEAIKQKAKVIACSSLLTMTMGILRDVVIYANEAGIHGKVKILVGGGPVTQNFCDKIGADYYAPNAVCAGKIAFEICTRSI